MDRKEMKPTGETLTAGQRAWHDRIDPLSDEVDAAESARYYDPARICAARAELQDAIEAWRLEYPADALRRRAQAKRRRAEHEESLAAGALVYDADGGLSPKMQEERAAEFRAAARALDAEAARLDDEAARLDR